MPSSFPPFAIQVLFSALLPPHSPGGQRSPCRCCDPEGGAALEAGWCCLEESKKKIRVKGNTVGGQRLSQTSRGTEAVSAVRVQPAWCGGFSPESTASNSSSEGYQFLQEPENCQENVSCGSHSSPDPGFGEFRARSEFQGLPKVIIQATPGLGREGPGYNPALIHPTSAWSEPPHSLKNRAGFLGVCCLGQTMH